MGVNSYVKICEILMQPNVQKLKLEKLPKWQLSCNKIN